MRLQVCRVFVIIILFCIWIQLDRRPNNTQQLSWIAELEGQDCCYPVKLLLRREERSYSGLVECASPFCALFVIHHKLLDLCIHLGKAKKVTEYAIVITFFSLALASAHIAFGFLA